MQRLRTSGEKAQSLAFKAIFRLVSRRLSHGEQSHVESTIRSGGLMSLAVFVVVVVFVVVYVVVVVVAVVVIVVVLTFFESLASEVGE